MGSKEADRSISCLCVPLRVRLPLIKDLAMKPTSAERREAHLEALIWLSYAVLVIPAMAVAMYSVARLYAWVFLLEWNSPLSIGHVSGLMIVMLCAIPSGLSIGGWCWLLVGRFLFHFPQNAAKKILFYGPRIKFLDRYNGWCLSFLYGVKGRF